MRILLTGATGLIGRSLTAFLLAQGHQVTALTRDPQRAKNLLGQQVTCWATLDDKEDLNHFDAVINLAGEPIAEKRWTSQQKDILCQSRWQITERLTALIKASSQPPSVFISGSAVGFYGDQGQALVTEEETPHQEFTHQLCERWEDLAIAAESRQTRVCLLRTGIVLAPDGGALSKMVPVFRLGLGGAIGDGRQYISWIHIDDMIHGIYYLLITDTLRGPFNMVSPYPVHNEQFTATLAEVLDRPSVIRTPAAAIRLLMGESAILVLGGQRAMPKKLEEAGFGFRYYELEDALRDVLKKPEE